MLERLPRFQRNLGLLAFFALLGWFAWSIRPVLNPLLAGYLLAYIVHPMVVSLEGRGRTRRSAVNLIFTLAAVGGLVVVIGMGLQGRKLVRDVVQDDEVRGRITTKLEDARESLARWVGEENLPELDDPAEIWATIQDYVAEHDGAVQRVGEAGVRAAGGVAGFVFRLLGSVIEIAGWFVLVPLYTYYFLFELGRLHAFIRRYLPIRERERISSVGRQIGEVLASFFRGRLVVCLLKGLVLSIGLKLAGIPYSFLFGMTSGFLSLIPFFGPFLGFLAASLVALLDHSVLYVLVANGLVFGGAEVLEGYVLIPKILGDSLGLHPLVVLFALFAGGAALGMFGVLIALPLTAAIVILVKEFVLPALESFADESD